MIAGLTGGIGTGKSTVAKVFELLGCAIFNSDDAAKQAYFLPGVREEVIALVGSDAYTDEHHIKRTAISQKAFGDPSILEKLNRIIHPRVKQMFIQFCKENTGRVIIKESALLFEAGLEKDMDLLIVVDAPMELRIMRTMKRDQVTREAAMARISRQWAQEDKVQKAGAVIVNDEKQLVIPQVIKIFNQLRP